MAHKSFSYRGYDVLLAHIQKSKRTRGGKMRTMQVVQPCGSGYMIKKKFLYDVTNPLAFSEASKKAVNWINEQLNSTNEN